VNALDIAALTAGRPFCAGLLLRHANRLVFSLAKPDRWDRSDGRTRIAVMCVGGGQELGESVLDCVRREAYEETGSEVQLRSAPVTWWQDRDGTRCRVTVADAVRPLSVEVRPGPTVPYRPGLPTGPDLFVVHYLADLASEPRGGDVPALLEIPAMVAPRLRSGLSVAAAGRVGAILRCWADVPGEAMLAVPQASPEWRFVDTAEVTA
jgi:8-oxo-dGTP pyrophosphatase MutT (NUDIX family)